jgi:peptidoglycan/LPS O-acetylase OafA/YrhL
VLQQPICDFGLILTVSSTSEQLSNVLIGDLMAQHGLAVEAPSGAKKSSFYRPELDALRFLAFMMVFLRHCPVFGSFPGAATLRRAGGYGVCIFFMLSAYLIGALLIREKEKTGTVHIRAFFTRRILRIWPLYFLVLALGFSLGEVIKGEHIPIAALPYMLLLGGNFWVAKAGWQLGLLVPMWSLSIEEQFYLLVPSLMRLGGRAMLMVMSIVCIVGAYLALAWYGLHGAGNVQVWVSSLVQFQFFGAGTLLALALHSRVWKAGLPARYALFVGGLTGLFVVEGLWKLQDVHPSSVGHLVVGYAAVLLCCLGLFLSVLNLPIKLPSALIYLGRISFGLYVYHVFVLTIVFKGGVSERLSGFTATHELLMAGVCLLLTIGVASLSFRYFEQPILRFKDRFSYVRSGA